MPVRVRRSNRLRPGPAPRTNNHVGGAGWGQMLSNQQVIRSKQLCWTPGVGGGHPSYVPPTKRVMPRCQGVSHGPEPLLEAHSRFITLISLLRH
jgi:hypothetical protein